MTNFPKRGFINGLLDPAGLELNPDGKPLSADARRNIQSILDRYSPGVEALAAQSFDLTAEAEEVIWDNQLYQTCPFVWFNVERVKERHGDLILLRCLTRASWIVSYVIDSSDWPELARVMAEMAALRGERAQEVFKCIKAL